MTGSKSLFLISAATTVRLVSVTAAKRRRIASGMLIASVIFVAPLEVRAGRFSELVIFGASVSDTGNVAELSPPVIGFSAPPSPPYFMGRFSNGPVWVDVLSDQLGLSRPVPSAVGGKNYAFSAATTGSVDNQFRTVGLLDMDDQLAEYLAAHTPGGDELIVISGVGAANDFNEGQMDPAEPVAFIGKMLSDLGAAGAKNVLLSNAIESVRLRNAGLLVPFNDLLSAEVEAQRIANPGLTIYEFDADQVMNTILASPSDIGITNTLGQACLDCGGGMVETPIQVASTPNEFLLWDNVHFTEPVHEVLGVAAFHVVPEPSSEMDASCRHSGIHVLSPQLRRSHVGWCCSLTSNGSSLVQCSPVPNIRPELVEAALIF